jgi:hypothetical protein
MKNKRNGARTAVVDRWTTILILGIVLTPVTGARAHDVSAYDDYFGDYYSDDIYDDFGWDYDWTESWADETPYGEWQYVEAWGDGPWQFDNDWWC